MPLQRHPRTQPVNKALSEASKWILEWQEKHNLTDAEVLAWHARCLAQIAKYTIREERAQKPTMNGDSRSRT